MRPVGTGLGTSRVLVVTAVEAERIAVRFGLVDGTPEDGDGGHDGDDNDRGHGVVAAGVGVAAAAAGTARTLALAEAAGQPYDGVICAGIAGGFAGRADVGGLVLADRSIAADFGAQTPDGFVGPAELGLGEAAINADGWLLDTVRAALPDADVGSILTVATVTGTADRADTLHLRHPDAAAEAMEGFGVGTAAKNAGLPFLEMRTVSNLVGPRDRGAWRVQEALHALTGAFTTLCASR